MTRSIAARPSSTGISELPRSRNLWKAGTRAITLDRSSDFGSSIAKFVRRSTSCWRSNSGSPLGCDLRTNPGLPLVPRSFHRVGGLIVLGVFHDDGPNLSRIQVWTSIRVEEVDSTDWKTFLLLNARAHSNPPPKFPSLRPHVTSPARESRTMRW